MTDCILITGGSGFLGQHLARALAKKGRVVIASRNEKNLRKVSSTIGVDSYPLDVSNENSVNEAFRRLKPDIVIHAAATKFVDMAEKYPNECIDINVRGSQNVARAAMHFKTSRVIGVSTDKVTSPIANLYGLSKAVMERSFLLSNETSETLFACVRYGNVAWSTGSVFPIWEQMTNSEGSITSTGPDMYRFFFSVNDAVNLVQDTLQSIDNLGGKIISLPMKGAKIRNILDIWSELFNVPWMQSQQRFGDREYELLIAENEIRHATEIEINNRRYFQLSLNNVDSTNKSFSAVYSSITAPQLEIDEIKDLILNKPEIIH